MNPRTQNHPQPGAPAQTLAEITTQAWEAAAKLAAAGHTVHGMDIKLGQRPRICLAPSVRLADLADKAESAVWTQWGIRAGQRFRTGQMDWPGVVVTWREVDARYAAKRRA